MELRGSRNSLYIFLYHYIPLWGFPIYPHIKWGAGHGAVLRISQPPAPGRKLASSLPRTNDSGAKDGASSNGRLTVGLTLKEMVGTPTALGS